MKDIDFLPEWYKAGKRRKANYRRQYLAVAGIILVMFAWSAATSYSVSVAKGQVVIIKDSLSINGPIAKRCVDYQAQIEELQDQKEILDKLGQQTTMSSVMAELSNLCNDTILIDKFSVNSESYKSSVTDKSSSSVRVGGGTAEKTPDHLDMDLRMKVSVTGVASGPSGVGFLISKLEDSDYFCQIVPGYSRPKKEDDQEITEFEISFFVANYKELQ